MDNIVENNKLIAEFMGWKENKDMKVKLISGGITYYFQKNDEACIPETMCYHSDWNWLMTVVEKIENIKIKDYSISTDITDDKTFINVWHYGDGGKWSILISNLNEEYKDFNKMQRTYKAVVKFINFYNKQKEE